MPKIVSDTKEKLKSCNNSWPFPTIRTSTWHPFWPVQYAIKLSPHLISIRFHHLHHVSIMSPDPNLFKAHNTTHNDLHKRLPPTSTPPTSISTHIYAIRSCLDRQTTWPPEILPWIGPRKTVLPIFMAHREMKLFAPLSHFPSPPNLILGKTWANSSFKFKAVTYFGSSRSRSFCVCQREGASQQRALKIHEMSATWFTLKGVMAYLRWWCGGEPQVCSFSSTLNCLINNEWYNRTEMVSVLDLMWDG